MTFQRLLPLLLAGAFVTPAEPVKKAYCREVLDRTLDKLSRVANTDAALYPYRLALAHEDMHGEALLITLQTLGLPGPDTPAPQVPGRAPAQIAFSGGTLMLGRPAQGNGFVFDNEVGPHAVRRRFSVTMRCHVMIKTN